MLDHAAKRRNSVVPSQSVETSPTHRFLHSRSSRTVSNVSNTSTDTGKRFKSRIMDFVQQRREDLNNSINFEAINIRKMKLRKMNFQEASSEFSQAVERAEERLVKACMWMKFILRSLVITAISFVVVSTASTLLIFMKLGYMINSEHIANFARHLGDMIEQIWVNSCLFLFPRQTLHLTGEFPKSGSPKIILCNHSTEADWFFVWMLTKLDPRIDFSGHLKITLKDEIKSIPLFGWGCMGFQFIFLKRDWKLDEETIKTSIKRFLSNTSPTWLLIFPEGNTVNTRSVMKCQGFAKEQNRPNLTKLLLPRRKGLHAIIEEMQLSMSQHEFEKVELFDMTMSFDCYSGEVPSWEMGYSRKHDIGIPTIKSFIMGNSSRDCFFKSTKYTLKEVQSYSSLEAFLDEKWAEKEQDLLNFAKSKTFGSPTNVIQVEPNFLPTIALMLGYVVTSWFFYAAMTGSLHLEDYVMQKFI